MKGSADPTELWLIPDRPLCEDDIVPGVRCDSVATHYAMVLFNGPLKRVELCKPHFRIREAQAAPFRDRGAEIRFSVSGDDDEDEQDEAPAEAVEPPAVVRELEPPLVFMPTQKVEPTVGNVPDWLGVRPSLDHFKCAVCGPKARWLKKDSRPSHVATHHPELLHFCRVEWLPAGEYSCDAPDHLRVGCIITGSADEIALHKRVAIKVPAAVAPRTSAPAQQTLEDAARTI